MRRILCGLLVALVVASTVAGAFAVNAAAAPPMGPDGKPAPDPGPDPAPAPEPTPAPSTPSNISTPAPNGSGSGGFWEGLVGSVASGEVRTQGMSALQLFAYVVIAAVAYTPAPNNMANYFFNPDNGMWEGRYDYLQDKVMPLYWAFLIVFAAIYLADGYTNFLTGQNASGGWRRLLLWGLVGYLSPMFAGIWLNLRRGFTIILLQDLTVSSAEASLSAGVVFLAVLFLLWTDGWALATLALIVGGVIVIIPAAYSWLPLICLCIGAPWFFVRLVAAVLLQAWVVLSLLTLPIALFVGTGFSLDLAPQITDTALAIESGVATEILSEAVQSVLLFSAKFGSLVVGVLLAHKLIGLIDTVTPGINLTPGKESVQGAAQRTQERVVVARDRARAAPEKARAGVERVRETDVSGRVERVRSRVGSRFRADGGQPQGGYERTYEPPEPGEASQWLSAERQRQNDPGTTRERFRDDFNHRDDK